VVIGTFRTLLTDMEAAWPECLLIRCLHGSPAVPDALTLSGLRVTNLQLIPIPYQSPIFVGSSSAPQRT